MVKLSFVIPVYNVELYLHKCLDSILNQIDDLCEVIVIDDGSTDNSGIICDEYEKKNKVIKVIHKKNGGLSDARNEGIRHACGEYICFVDSDDYIEDKVIPKILSQISETKADVYFMEAIKFFSDGSNQLMNDGIKRDFVLNKSREEVLSNLSYANKYPGSACTKIIKRQIILNWNLFFPVGKYSEDLSFCMDLLLYAETYDCCEFSYYYYRQNRKGSITNKISMYKFNDLLYFVSTYADKFTNTPKSEFEKAAISFVAYEYCVLIYLFAQLNKSERKKVFYSLKKYEWLLNFTRQTSTKIVKVLCRYLGLRGCSWVLLILKKLK